MLVTAVVAILGSVATAYLIGYAVIASRETFVRTKVGVTMLVALGVSFLLLPPQLTAANGLVESLGTQLPESLTSSLVWPSGLDRGLYIGTWLVLTVAGLLAGMRIWDAGKPGWRAGARSAMESAGERALGLLPLAASLDEVLAVLAKSPLTLRDIEFLEPQLLLAGARFALQLPVKRSDAFNLVVKRVPATIAVRVTELLQQGAAERTSTS